MVKVRLIEGASNGDISFYMSNHYAGYEVDSVAGNLIEAQKHLLKYYRLSAIIDSELDYYNNIGHLMIESWLQYWPEEYILKIYTIHKLLIIYFMPKC